MLPQDPWTAKTSPLQDNPCIREKNGGETIDDTMMKEEERRRPPKGFAAVRKRACCKKCFTSPRCPRCIILFGHVFIYTSYASEKIPRNKIQEPNNNQ
jgi:hypothetical protein